jgi:hypothetical protein
MLRTTTPRLRRLCLVTMWLMIGIGCFAGVSALVALWWWRWLEPQTVTVRVVNSSGEPIADATVVWLAFRYMYGSSAAFKNTAAAAERSRRSQLGYLFAGPPDPKHLHGEFLATNRDGTVRVWHHQRRGSVNAYFNGLVGEQSLRYTEPGEVITVVVR